MRFTHSTLLFLTLAFLTACGSDVAATASLHGAGTTSTADGSASLDGQAGGDGAAGDASVGSGDGQAVADATQADFATADAVAPGNESCAGRCGQYDKAAVCQCDKACGKSGDCCSNFKDLCVTGPANKCGDGQCDPGETSASCPDDCGLDPAQLVSCLKDQCPATFSTCQADATCGKVLACVQGCDDQGCIQGCTDGVNPGALKATLGPLVTCGDQQGCLGGGGGGQCGDGACTPPEDSGSCPEDCPPGPKSPCGNGKCEPGESKASCPADCGGGGGNAIEQCLAQNCPKSWAACTANDNCFGAAQCVEKGGSVQQCAKGPKSGALLQAAVQCGIQNGCLQGDSGGGSCKDRCGEYDPNEPCQCDDVCGQMGNCCADIAQECGGPAASVCGDGQCDVAAGEPATCPADCGTPPKPGCKTKADCAPDEVCCASANGKACVALGQCK
jgi:hypothetical protein